MVTWSAQRIHELADRMAARLGCEVRVSALTLPTVVTALRAYADELKAQTALGAAEYQVREWNLRGNFVRELAVCRDITAAQGAFAAVYMEWPQGLFTFGQGERILRSTEREPIMLPDERRLLAPPVIEGET